MSASAFSTSSIASDVLVLGAGLAGMRAAWAAKQAAPSARVLFVSPRRRPSGSSFANRNDALGVQAPATPAEADAFVAEALRLAPPGEIDEALVRALAADAPARIRELAGLGMPFRADAPGVPLRFAGCFSAMPRAVIVDGLSRLHAVITAHLSSLGVETLCGFEALGLPRDESGRVLGARLAAIRGGKRLDVRARAVVAAMGGPAPLFARRMCGPGGSGLGFGLLATAGTALVNTRFLQFFWLREPDRAFVNPGCLDWPPDMAGLAAARRAHCPVSFGLPDAELDARLLALRGPDGVARPEGGPALALYAHAGNGGARINENGRTTTPGLFACGECAGGMHGANRLGGAMTLSCLVFGARAGAAAAKEAETASRETVATPGRTHSSAFRTPSAPPNPPDSQTDLPGSPPAGSPAGPARDDHSATFLRRLRRGMDRHATPGGSPDPVFNAWLRAVAERTGGGNDFGDASAAVQRRRLLARSALAVLEG